MPNPVSSPLGDYEFYSGSNGYWVDASYLDVGVEVYGTNSASVPDSGSTALMLVCGLAGLGAAVARRIRQTA